MGDQEEVIDTPLAGIDVVNEGKKLRARQDAMQKKTFTKWYNSYLQQRDLKVNDLFVDLHDGIVLFNLLEVLSGEKILPKLQPNPRFTAQKLENIQASLNFIKRKGVEVSTIGTTDIANGNEVLIMGLSWMLILRFEVQKFSADIQELLRWCKKRTADYPNVKVENFTSSFKDGLALNALIHKHAPELINYDALDPKDAIGNINNALDVAERELGVPKLLDATDLATNPEEKSVITYVARLRQALAAREEELKLRELQDEEDAKRRAAEEDALRRAAEEEARRKAAEEARRKAEEEARLRAEAEARRKAEEEAARLAAEEAARRKAEEDARLRAEEEARRKEAERKKALDDLNGLLPNFLDRAKHEKETDDMIEDFNLRSKDLADWIKNRDDKMQDAVDNKDLGNTIEEVDDKLDHLRDDVPEKETEKLDLETLNNDINTRLKQEGRPRPNHDVPIEKVNGLWNHMSATEQGYKKALLERKEELKKQGATLERFNRIAKKLNDWVDLCGDVIHLNDLGNSVVETTELIAEHERFARDSKAQAKTFKELQNVAKLLPNHPDVDQTVAKLAGVFDPLPQHVKERSDQLQKELARQKNIETQRLKFFEDNCDFNEYLFAAEEYANNPLDTDTEQAIAALLDPLKRVSNSIKLPEVATPEEEADLREAKARFDAVVPILEGRKAAIRDNHGKKKQAEELYQKFAAAASKFEAWYNKNSALIAEDATLELMRQRVKGVIGNLPEGQALVNAAAAIQSQIDALHLPGPNPHTVYTLDSLKNQYEHIKKWANDRNERFEHPLAQTNAPQVVKSLDALAADKGKISSGELYDILPAELAQYIEEKSQKDAQGNIEYNSFNPYPQDNVRKTSTSAPASRPTSAHPSPIATQPTPQETKPSGRVSQYGPPSASKQASRGSIYNSAPSPQAAVPPSPVTRHTPTAAPAAEVDDSELPEFDDSMRKKKEIEEGLYLYTTQTTTSPLAVRYELEVSKYEIIEFRVNFDGSDNIRLLKPASGTLIAVSEVPAFQTKIVAIVQQIDPYKPASLRTKYSWTSRLPE